MRLTRREFIQASLATAGMLVAGCATQSATPVTSAMVVRKAKPAGPAKGDWVASTCQGCTQWCAIQIFVEEGRAVRVRGNPLSKTNHGYVCPRGHLIPQQVYDPDRIKVPMKRTNAQKGRGIDPKFVPITWDEALDTDRRQDDRAAQEQRGAQARLHARPLLADFDRAPLRRAAKDLRHDQLLLAQRDLRRSREDGSRADAGLLRLPRLRPREDQLPRDLGLRSARVQPHGPQHDRALPRDRGARHGDHRRPAPLQRRREVAGVAAGQARHRRRTGRCDGPRAADRRTVEPRVRRRLQGRQEPVRRRTGGGRGGLRREGDPSVSSNGGISSSRTARRPGPRRKR